MYKRQAYNSDADVRMPNFAGISPWRSPVGQVPEYPRASNERETPAPTRPNGRAIAAQRGSDPNIDALRAELRQLVVEELAQLIKR